MAAFTGCASNPNRDVNEARVAEIEAERGARDDAAGAERKRAEGQAERDRGAQDARTERQYGGSASGDRVMAESKMTEERRKHLAQVTERVHKLDARAAELRAKVGQAGSKLPTEARDGVDAIRSQRELVGRETQKLTTVGDDGWEAAKKSTEVRIDELEAITKRAAEKVER